MKESDVVLKADPGAIIIFMSDHGPWMLDAGKGFWNPTLAESDYTSVNFRDDFGAFMAIRWPDRERAEKYDADFDVTQDLFPIVFSYLFDSDAPRAYKPKDTAIRWKHHKFDKGVLYPYFYQDDYDNQLSGQTAPLATQEGGK